MKHSGFRLAIALLTCITGVAAAGVLLSQHKLPTMNNAEIAGLSGNLPQPAQSPSSTGDEAGPLDAVFIKGDKLSYAGYDVERSVNTETNESSARIRQKGKILLTLSDGGMGKDSTEIGLFSFLGGETKQLVVMQYTGGAHCCWIYRIYDLKPGLRALFNGEEYGIESIGYELHPEDIDGDGRYEFTQAVMTFDYFHMSHATSVFPSAVFSYDEERRKYFPDNRKFSSYLLKGIDEDLRKVEEARAQMDVKDIIARETYLSAVLQVMLKYIYAGRDTDGWQFYDREYKLFDRDEIKADIKKALEADPIYQSIYP
jgi:hypothetical protein